MWTLAQQSRALMSMVHAALVASRGLKKEMMCAREGRLQQLSWLCILVFVVT